jgi:hypothetical protein
VGNPYANFSFSPIGMSWKTTMSHTLAGRARSSRVHRQAAGRDYAAPLQWKTAEFD